MEIKPITRGSERGSAVYSATGVKLAAFYGAGSKRRAYTFKSAQGR